MRKIVLGMMFLLLCLGIFLIEWWYSHDGWEDIDEISLLEGEVFPVDERIGKYFWIDEERSVVSDVIPGSWDDYTISYLHFPTGKYSTLYLSGHAESRVFLINDEPLPNSESLQDYIKSLQETYRWENSILYSFYQASGYSQRVSALMIMGSFREPNIFLLPEARGLEFTTTLVSIVSREGSEIFWELSNKDTYLSEGPGLIFRHLEGSDYEPAYQGLEILYEESDLDMILHPEPVYVLDYPIFHSFGFEI